MNNLMTMDEIYRLAYMTVIVGTPMTIGFMASFFVYREHIKDLQDHVKDLREAVFVLLPKHDGSK